MEIEKARETFLGISVGVYITREDKSYDQMYIAADQALYQTKKKEKGCYTIIKDSKE